MSANDTLRVQRAVAPVREQILSNLRLAIVEQRFRPGERLIERELCELTGASRTSVREALRQLESEGLITNSPRGPAVAVITPAEARDIYDTRALLESRVGELFAERATDAQVAEIEERLADIAAAGEDVRALLAAKHAFYELLLEGARNPVIRSMLDLLRARVSVLRAVSLSHPGRRDAMLEEMRAIVDAIKRRDRVAAGMACAAHVHAAAELAIDGRVVEPGSTAWTRS